MLAMPRRKIELYPILNEWLKEIIKNLWKAKTKGSKAHPFSTPLVPYPCYYAKINNNNSYF